MYKIIKMVAKINIAGCYVFDKKNKKILTVCNHSFTNYSAPKGHLDDGENLLDCAIRELNEETGLSVDIINKYKKDMLSNPIRKYRVNDNLYTLYQFNIDDGSIVYNKLIPIDKNEIGYVQWIDYKTLESLRYNCNKTLVNKSNKNICSCIADVIR